MTNMLTLPMSMGRTFRGTRNQLVARMDEIATRAETEWARLGVERDEIALTDWLTTLEVLVDLDDMWNELNENLARIDAEAN